MNKLKKTQFKSFNYLKKLHTSFLPIFSLVVAIQSITGCSVISSKNNESNILNNNTSQNNPSEQKIVTFNNQGSLIISRKAPEFSVMYSKKNSLKSSKKELGFVNLPENINKELEDNSSQKTWILIDKTSNEVTIFSENKNNYSTVFEKTTAKNLETLTPGVYTVQLKVKDPSWYASDSYYENRNLDIPNSGDKNRFLKGALGEYALFIDNLTPLYSTQFSTNEINGVNINGNCKNLYDKVQIGSRVIIR